MATERIGPKPHSSDEMLRSELHTAITAARLAGEAILEHQERRRRRPSFKADQSPVTEADIAAHWVIVRQLRVAFPDDAVISEEDLQSGTQMEPRTWLVDPLDGTRDYLAGTGEYAVHIALVEEGRPRLGVVYQPVPRALFHGVVGQGAFLEHEGLRLPLRVSSTASLAAARIGISRTNLVGHLRRFLEEKRLWPNTRPMGASTKLMALARGELDAVINLSSSEMPWDTAAPGVILREAGGRYTMADGAPLPDGAAVHGTLATNGVLHDALVDVLAGYHP